MYSFFGITNNAAAQYAYYDVVPFYDNYAFSYNQVPENLVGINPGITGVSFQWEQSLRPVDGFAPISGATLGTYSFTAALTQTTYYRRKAIVSNTVIYSNTLKIELVSANWENFNYVREHDILIPGVSTWTAIDNLPVGQKLQTTTYLDGIGRPLQKISRETATPPVDPNSLWGDAVKFYKYDALGRQTISYLPYTTTTESGKYKTTPATDQTAYYSTVYNETSAFNTPTYDNSPLNRVLNVKSPGTSWAAGLGNSTVYDLNDATENVQMFSIGYTVGAVPVNGGAYLANTLYKIKSIDENGKQVIEYINKSGQSVLTKTQLEEAGPNLSVAHKGWICTYSVYDDFGLLRYRFQPEAVKWLDANGWSFTGTNGQQVLNELCFRYDYDEKGRTILKKAPGAKELYMIYDKRDRVVFMQDGNQRILPGGAQWTANIYDELDRPVITTLYNTSKTVATLQADINNAGNVSSVTVTAQSITTATYNNPITNTDLNNASVTTIVKYNFYDTYAYSGAKPFNTNFDNLQAYPTGGDPIASTQRTLNIPTGSITRILNSNTFLTGTVYYDDKGRTIQATEDNIKTGTDVTTMQYQWDGRELSSNTKHTATNTGYSNFSIITKNIFDKIGRVTSIQKKYGSNAFKTIANYAFDDMGRLKNKKLDPDYTNTTTGTTGLETLGYSYNIHNEITGINKDYALKTPGLYNKWSNYFGLYLGYDNRDNTFTTAQLDGHVTGLLWNTQGDDAQRKYDFTYDNAGRLTNAFFKERQTTAAAWDNSKMDFTVTGSNGKIGYDLNGNLITMLQKGILPGATAPYNMDNLQYSYASLSNKLMRVTDNGTLATANGKLGDFADGTNTGDDYVYDDNGNLIIDLNKNATPTAGNTGGIKYNFLDKPYEVHIAGKGTITMVYDADGNKLQKTFTPEVGGTAKTTTYINEFIYEGDVLQYINFEEGRLRVMQAVNQNNGFDILTIDGNADLPGSKRGAYDYFLRDYQGNVRMILTEETHLGSNSCTMELTRASNEEPIFGQVDANGAPTASNEVQARFAVSSIPGQSSGGGWQNPAIANHVSRLGNLAQSKVGPNALLKVMAGDKVSATTIYYYQNPVVNSFGSNTLLTSLLQSLASAITGSSITAGTVKNAAGSITTQLGGSTPFINATSPDGASKKGNNPKAYLTLLFFDERFNFVAENSTALRVQQAGNGAPALVIDNVKAPKNGYAFVYVSNEANEMLYFDNLQVTQNHARIIEENHYYSYGLKIAGISSRKLPDAAEGGIKNNNLYNDKELIDDADLNWYDYGFRSYDAQIGRFPQLDPLTDDYPYYTPYQYAGCEPIANVDIDGLEPFNTIQTLGEVIVSCAPKIASPSGISVARLAATLIPKATLPIITNYSVYQTINNNRTISSFLTPAVGNPVPMLNYNGQNYILAGNYQDVSTKTEWVDNSKEIAKGKALNDFFDKLIKYKQVSGGNGGATTYRNGLGKTIWIPGSDGPLGDDLVGQAFGFYAAGGGFGAATKGVGSLKIPIYRVYGEGASMYGKSYSLINPKYVPFYRNFAGLPGVNSGQYLLKGSIPLRDINVGRWFAAPLNGNTGGLPFELYQNYNQLINPVNVILKKPF